MKFLKKILTNPFTILASIIAGVAFGFYFPAESISHENIGLIYLSLSNVDFPFG